MLYNASLETTCVPILLLSIFGEGCNEEKILLHKAALCLRKFLLEVKGNLDLLPRSLTAQYFKQGMAPIPTKCLQFFTSVLCSDPSNPTEKEKRLALSLSSDLLYNVTKGHVKPAKHLAMGVAMKSMTGSGKVCDIVHKFGHSISCSQEKEIITEMAEEI